MNYKHALDFSVGLFCYLFSISMFFYFPGVEAWAFSAFQPSLLTPDIWINLLLVLVVVLPAVIGPLVFILRAKKFAKAKLTGGCLALAGLLVLAGFHAPLLYGRVALIALLSGQLLALGSKEKESVPFNWMIYIGFIIANLNFPDAPILSGADFLAGAYLIGAAVLALKDFGKPAGKERSRVMVG